MSRSVLRRAGLLLAATALTMTGFAAPPAQAAETYTVDSLADDDDGSCTVGDCNLREAITLANSDVDLDTINFNLPVGQTTIAPGSQLPQILYPITIDGLTQPGATETEPEVEIDGSYATGTVTTGLWLAAGSAGSTVQGLVINRFTSEQILVDTANNSVLNNHLGVDRQASEAVDAPTSGTLVVRVGGNNTLIIDNVIGNGGSSAPAVSLANVSSSTVQSNFIGVNRNGSSLGSGSGSIGVRVTGASATGNAVISNSIDTNGGLGIDLGGDGVTANDAADADPGVNRLQNYPVLTTATSSPTQTVVTGTLDSTPSTLFTVWFYASPGCDPSGFGEGRRPLGVEFVTTDAGGSASFSTSLAATSIGSQVTATVSSNSARDSSEFSQCLTVAPPAPRGVTAAAGDGEAEVAWLESTPAGGAVDSYTVSSIPDTATTPILASSGQTAIVVPGLANGTEYTFTVTANKDGQSSPPSDPSDPVTPRAGSPAPQATSATVSAGGQVSTGSGATPTDPTNTTIVSPNDGVVSIGEGATTQPAPDGGDYYGQQVDVTAPDATATDPLELTFVVDCSVLPEEVSTCPSPRRAWARSAPRATVSVRDGSYSPRQARVDLGGKVTWRFTGKLRHSVTESKGLAARGRPLFDSRPKGRGARFSQRFTAAGAYAYGSTVRGDPARMRGTVGVPVEVDGETVFWARSLPAGTAADVQYRHRATAGDPWSAWTTWRDDTTSIGEELTADLAGTGDYQVRARVQNTRTDRASGWSPAALATLDGPSRLDTIDLWHQTDLGDPDSNEKVPDCTGSEGTVDPAPTCVWSEEVLPDGDLRIRVFSTINGRWRAG